MNDEVTPAISANQIAYLFDVDNFNGHLHSLLQLFPDAVGEEVQGVGGGREGGGGRKREGEGGREGGREERERVREEEGRG